MRYRVSKRDHGAGHRLGRHADDPARPGLRARLHVPEPGRLRPAVPVHARALLVPVLHLDEGREDWTRPRRWCSARRAPAATSGRTRSTTLARRLDPDDVLRRPSRVLQEQPLLHALQVRALLQGRREPIGRSPTSRSGSTSSTGSRRTPQEGPALADGHRVAPTASRRSSTPAASATTTCSATRA